jgi:dihydrofolate reductase
MDDAGHPNRRAQAERSGMQAPRRLALIAAVASNGVIGADGTLPWRLLPDLRRFRALTVGHAVVMGRKTWESLPRALAERQNIVVTRRRNFVAPGAEVVGSLDEALDRVELPDPVFCIGGGELYRTAMPRAAVLHLTELERSFAGDATFPAFDRSEWMETAREAHVDESAEPAMRYWFVTYERRASAPPGSAAES